MDVEKEVKRSFVKLPDKIREKETSGQYPFSTKTKFVYLVISWYQYSNYGQSPSIKMMRERFGIDSKTYLKALEELSNSGFVKYKKHSTSTSIDVDIIDKNKEAFSMIPTSVILTRVLTNNHKIFVAIMWKMFASGRNGRMSEIHMTTNEIVKEIKKIGFSKNYIYKYINELSSKDSGYINVFTRNKNVFKINFENLFIISEYEFGETFMSKKNKKKFIYVSPVPFEYTIDEESLKVIRNKEFKDAETKLHKKLISDIDFVNNL